MSSVARIEPEAPPQARGGSTVGLSHWERWLEFCARIDGFPRHLSIHSGGMLVTAAPLIDEAAAAELDEIGLLPGAETPALFPVADEDHLLPREADPLGDRLDREELGLLCDLKAALHLSLL